MAAALITSHHRSLQRVDAQRGRAPPPPRASVLVDVRDRRSPAAVLVGSQTCQRARGGRAAEEARLADFAIAKRRDCALPSRRASTPLLSALCNEVDRDVWGPTIHGTVMSRHERPQGGRLHVSQHWCVGRSPLRFLDSDRGRDPATGRTGPVPLSRASPSRSFEEPAPGSGMVQHPDLMVCQTGLSSSPVVLAPGCLPEGVLGVPERWRLPEPVEEAKACAAVEAGQAA
ncbi:unnamed protein product [Trichogramma brassicae]|uniref:Uncharacterized protein n=1 Tax=Trichogramma brassicae TaxID=86971 RepID=A0A6H5HW31_9HYME|nr:unnamed protein product [Trichogramma brassicae]